MDKLKILLIEDDADDVQLLQEALDENNVIYELDLVMEGDKVQAYLQNALVLPDIIVLDFNLPKLHGKEILMLIRSFQEFAAIPVIVLTTSASPHDIQFAHDNGANKFITKPSTIRGFNAAVEMLLAAAKRS